MSILVYYCFCTNQHLSHRLIIQLLVPDLTFMVNRRGQMALIYEENIFHVNRRYEDKTFWKCMEYKKLQCKCRCTTTKGKIKRSKADHNHPPNTVKIMNKSYSMKYISSNEDPFDIQ